MNPQYIGLISSMISVVAIILTGIVSYYARRDRESIDKEFKDIRADIVEISTDLISYKQSKDTNCGKHYETIHRMELEIRDRKGENDLLKNDIENIKSSITEVKVLIKEIHTALQSIKIKK
jgi:hypothetical protein